MARQGKEEDTGRGIARRCHVEDLTELFATDTQMRWNYRGAVLNEAIGAGKSFMASIINAYMTHLWLCLRRPQEFFGLAPNSKVAVVNVGPSLVQAKSVVFTEIGNRVKMCPWFRDRGYVPNPRVFSRLEFDAPPHDTELKSGDVFKNIHILPLTSNEQGAIGYNVFAFVIDEASMFRDKADTDQADVLWDVLHRRMVSRFGEAGMGIAIGSPLYEGDFLERKFEEARRFPEAKLFTRRRSQWEAKFPDWTGPVFYFDTDAMMVVDRPTPASLVIPDTSGYRYEFVRNPDRALRDLGGRPTTGIDTYFKPPGRVPALFQQISAEPMSLDPRKMRVADWYLPTNRRAPHYVHVDISKMQGLDACGLVVSHPCGRTSTGNQVYVDLVCRFQGTPNLPIRLQAIRRFIVHELRGRLGFNIRQVSFDGFASIQLQQDLTYEDQIQTAEISVDKSEEPYAVLKEGLYDGRVVVYHAPSHRPERPSPTDVLIRELKGLERVPKNGAIKVDHAPNGSKDVADALAGSVYASMMSWEVVAPEAEDEGCIILGGG